jgi:hypothetical protein
MFDPCDLFLPNRPIRPPYQHFFRGRAELLANALDVMSRPGASLMLFGDRAVGKSSLAWQVMAVLSGDPFPLQNLDIKTSFSISRSPCVWLECNRSMRDLNDVLMALMANCTVTPCLRALFPDAFNAKVQEASAKACELNLGRESGKHASSRSSQTLRAEVRSLFGELISRISRVFKVNDLLIFLDDFDEIADRTGLDELFMTTDSVRFVILGTSHEPVELVPEEDRSSNVLNRIQPLHVGEMDEKELHSIFDRAEAVAANLITFSPEFRDLVIRNSERLPGFVQLMGLASAANCIRRQEKGERELPRVLQERDFYATVDAILPKFGVATVPGDPYRIDRLRVACRQLPICEAILLGLAGRDPGWSRIDFPQEVSGLPEERLSEALLFLVSCEILEGTLVPEERTLGLRFADPVLRLYVRLAAQQGPGVLAGMLSST